MDKQWTRNDIPELQRLRAEIVEHQQREKASAWKRS